MAAAPPRAAAAPPLRRGPPITLARAPLQTLYWFGASAACGARDAARFVATHPVTLFLALPALAYYGAAKGLGYDEGTTELMEVGVAPPPSALGDEVQEVALGGFGRVGGRGDCTEGAGRDRSAAAAWRSRPRGARAVPNPSRPPPTLPLAPSPNLTPRALPQP
jgi:hypothetical protein